MSTVFMQSHKPGIGNAASYQVSGKPFLTGSVSVPVNSGTPVEISFPNITKKILITNIGDPDIKIGFSSNGVKNTNFTIIHGHGSGTPSHLNTLELEVKCTSVFLISNNNSKTGSFCLVAELTNIPATELINNWSGSAGVG